MKLNKPKKSKLYQEEDESSSESKSSGGVAPWAITDRSKFKSLAKSSQTDGLRAPEFWVAEDEKRQIRFIDDDAIVAIRMYVIRGKNNRPERYVAPAEGEDDLFASVLNLRSQMFFIMRIIDIDGYTPKKGPNKGKKVTNQPKFYLLGSRTYEQVRMSCSEVPGIKLNSGNVVVCRSGSGNQTTYTFIPKAAVMTPVMKTALLKFPKWTDYYKPPTASQQRAIVARLGASEDSSDE